MASGSTKTVNIGFYQNGDTFTVPVDFVKNNGPDTASGVTVTLTIPDGITYQSSGLSQGSYNLGVWTVGTLIPGQSVSATFTFTVTDDCESPWTIEFDVATSGGCDGCLTNNNLCIVTNGVSCCDFSGCGDPEIQTVAVAAHTVLVTENTFLADATSNVVAFTLPTPAAAYNSTTLKGQTFTFKVVEFSNAVTVTTPSGKLVDNSTIAAAGTVYNFAGVGDSITVVSDGTNYYIV
jgi:uncharacterized repeat protein (TIGR01451 family)